MNLSCFSLIAVAVLYGNCALGAQLQAAPVGDRTHWCSPQVKGEPTEGAEARVKFSRWISDVVLNIERYHGPWLERIIGEWKSPNCIMDDGQPRLVAFESGVAGAFFALETWDERKELLKAIKRELPRGSLLAIIEAKFWVLYAWDARGSGYASTVTKEGWELFHQRLAIAEKILDESKGFASELPQWYDLMFEIKFALNRPTDDTFRVLAEGTQSFPNFYPLYFHAINYLLPKWGGSWETVDGFTDWAVSQTKALEGETMYARIYWSASGHLKESEYLFKDTKAKWPRMKKGFEDLLTRYPNSLWNRAAMLKFSCSAGDIDTFLEQRAILSKTKSVPPFLDGAAGLAKCKENLPTVKYMM